MITKEQFLKIKEEWSMEDIRDYSIMEVKQICRKYLPFHEIAISYTELSNEYKTEEEFIDTVFLVGLRQLEIQNALKKGIRLLTDVFNTTLDKILNEGEELLDIEEDRANELLENFNEYLFICIKSATKDYYLEFCKDWYKYEHEDYIDDYRISEIECNMFMTKTKSIMTEKEYLIISANNERYWFSEIYKEGTK